MWFCAVAYIHSSRLFTENKKAGIPVMPDALPVSATPATYESLPVKIQAVRWDGTANHASEIIDWIHQNERNASYACDAGVAHCSGTDADHHLLIRTLEGNMAAEPGSWIIMGTEGEFYPCKDSVFQRKYKASN